MKGATDRTCHPHGMSGPQSQCSSHEPDWALPERYSGVWNCEWKRSEHLPSVHLLLFHGGLGLNLMNHSGLDLEP